MRCTRSQALNFFASLGVACAMAAVASPAVAQLAVRQSNERVLVLIPAPDSAADRDYVVQLADEIRRRMRSKMRHKLVVVSSEDVCKVLEESAYQCDVVLGRADAERLARAVRADAYMVGRMWRERGTPVARFHLIDIGRSGLSGWMTVRGTPGDPPRQFAETVVDSMENQVRAAEYSRECSERRDRGDFTDAKQRAQRAFRLYPNHPSSALCAWVVSEAMQEPVDSQIAMLERAVAGDSLFARAWERLGRAYNQRGDSAKALEAFARQSAVNAGDRDLRLGVIAGARLLGEYAQARDLADSWLEANPQDLEFLQIKAAACVEGGLWQCALEALSQEYGLDSSLVGDSVFYQQIIGAAQALGNIDEQLRWSALGVQHVPQSVSLLRAHASALAAAEMTDSVVVVYDRLLGLDSTDVRSALAAARILLEGVVIDTATPLDTARLVKGGAFLDAAVAASQDTSVLMNAAVLYYQRGSELVRTRQMIATAVDWLERSLQTDVLNRLTTQTNFFLGLGLMFRIFEFDPQVTETESCELVQEEASMVARGKAALELGASLSPGSAQQFLQQYRTFEERIPTLRRAYNCQ